MFPNQVVVESRIPLKAGSNIFTPNCFCLGLRR
jgi:hypothetical protein